MNYGYGVEMPDHGAHPFVANMEQLGVQNANFRTTIWTGGHLQTTLMCIPPCGEIGLEIHEDTDQFIRVEQGFALAKVGKYKDCLEFQRNMYRGDAVFIPAGTWHNIINMERTPLKLSVMYAPPNHPKGTLHRTKANAEMEEGMHSMY